MDIWAVRINMDERVATLAKALEPWIGTDKIQKVPGVARESWRLRFPQCGVDNRYREEKCCDPRASAESRLHLSDQSARLLAHKVGAFAASGFLDALKPGLAVRPNCGARVIEMFHRGLSDTIIAQEKR